MNIDLPIEKYLDVGVNKHQQFDKIEFIKASIVPRHSVTAPWNKYRR